MSLPNALSETYESHYQQLNGGPGRTALPMKCGLLNLHSPFRNPHSSSVTVSFEEIRDFFTKFSKALNPTAEII
jgi:hypothetical protein